MLGKDEVDGILCPGRIMPEVLPLFPILDVFCSICIQQESTPLLHAKALLNEPVAPKPVSIMPHLRVKAWSLGCRTCPAKQSRWGQVDARVQAQLIALPSSSTIILQSIEIFCKN